MAEKVDFSYDRDRLEEGITEVANSDIQGVKGIKVFSANNSSRVSTLEPTLYLGTLTHGNERMGAAALPYFLNGNIKLLQGRVIAAINNLEAADKGIRHVKGGLDFNRLPSDDILSGDYKNSTSPDIQRVQAIAGVTFQEVTHGFDCHTVPHSPISAMKLHEKGDTAFANSIGIPTYITNITDHQYNVADSRGTEGPRTVAFGNYIGGLDNMIPVAEIEGGGPEVPPIADSVVRATLSILAQLGMIDPEEYGLERRKLLQKRYKIAQWDYAPVGYRLAQQFGPYAAVKKGGVIMESVSGPSKIIAPFDGHLIMHPPYCTKTGERYVTDTPDDWWYSEPVVTEEVEVFV